MSAYLFIQVSIDSDDAHSSGNYHDRTINVFKVKQHHDYTVKDQTHYTFHSVLHSINTCANAGDATCEFCHVPKQISVAFLLN